MICSLSKHEAEKNGFDDALMLDYRGLSLRQQGQIFFVKNNKLYTPLPDCFLNGITRKTVIDIANKLGIEINEGHFKYDFLKIVKKFFDWYSCRNYSCYLN